MAKRNQERNTMVLNMLSSGKGMTEVSRETGLSFAIVQGIRRSVAALNRPGLVHRSRKESHLERLPWTPADELPDDDEPIGPVQRCQCGLVLPCGQCLSLQYVLDNRSAATPDDQQIDALVSSETPFQHGAGENRGQKTA